MKFLVVFLILFTQVLPSDACDSSLYLSSENSLCKDKKCSQGSTELLTLRTGSELCIQDSNNMITRIRLIQSMFITTYKATYRICIPKLVASYSWRCWNAGACNQEECHANTHTDGTGMPKRRTKSLSYVYSGCQLSGKCAGYCGYNEGDRCCFGLVEVISAKSFVLSEKINRYWAVDLEVLSATSSQKIHLSQLNPFSTLPFLSTAISLIPSREPSEEKQILELRPGVYTSVFASPKDQPIPGVLGDCQQDLREEGVIYPIETIQMSSETCHFIAKIPESPLSRMGYLNSSFQGKDLDVYSDGTGLEVRESIPSSLTFITNAVKVDSLIVSNPDCLLEVSYVIACTGCDERIRLGIKTRRLRTAGTIDIVSNCTIVPEYLRCQENPYEVLITGEPDACEISLENNIGMPSPNNTLVFPMNYTFVGGLHAIQLLAVSGDDVSFHQYMGAMVANPNFIRGLVMTAGAAAGILGVIRAGMFGISIWAGKKAAGQLGREI